MVTTEEVVALVRSSPEFVGKHDKRGWIGIFGKGYVIEDPVGSRPVRGDDISAFWDTFIEPNDIVFRIHHEWLDGMHVVRDVTIETTLQTGIVVRTPAHLRYECALQDGELKVERMAAHWEPAPVFAQLIRPRATHVRSMVTMNGRMIRHLGWGGTAQFVGAIRSVGRRGKKALVEHLGGSVQDLHKVTAAGEWVTASGTVAGRPVAVFARLDRKTRKVLQSKVYAELL